MSVDRISDEAAKAAIHGWFDDWDVKECHIARMRRAIAAALPLLEGGKGEPVAYQHRFKHIPTGKWGPWKAASEAYWNRYAERTPTILYEVRALYTAPQPAAQQPAVPALEVFRIAGGDVECCPEPTADEALECLRDLRKCYDEALQNVPLQQPAGDGGVDAVMREVETIWAVSTPSVDLETMGQLMHAKARLNAAIAALRANAGDTK